MENQGQIYATDADKRRLAPIYARLQRAGVRNVQVRAPFGDTNVLADLEARADLVLIDAPCTGTGIWRRNPDAKWRIRPGALAQRQQQQIAVLDRAAPLVKPGGRLIYITCSVLEEENADQIRGFLDRHHNFSILGTAELTPALGEHHHLFDKVARQSGVGLLMSPHRTDTDGFFLAVMTRHP
jgi:16S rRNA (cytosine967-C5)-methyltransferase